MKLFNTRFLSRLLKVPVYSSTFDFDTHPLPEANKWTLSEFVLRRIVPIVGVHPYPLDELLLMSSTMAYFRPDVIIEWGTHYGKSARTFYEISDYLHLGATIHTIDLAINMLHAENNLDARERAIYLRGLPVSLHLGDGVTVAKEIVTHLKPKLPLFFVDGDHSFESVSNELKSIKEICRSAVVLVHDTFFQGSESKYNCGPYEALKEFTDNNRLPRQATVLGLPGMSLTYWFGVNQ